MPIFMDVHLLPGVKARDVAEAHNLDLLMQAQHQCTCMTYWIDEGRGSVFCLIDAPNKEAVAELHRQSHGLVPHKIIEVNGELVESFLGRIYDPENAQVTPEGLKVFHDSSFRVLIAIRITDSVILQYKWGKERTEALLQNAYQIIRSNTVQYNGREIENEDSDFILSFTAAGKALSCALSIQKEITLEDSDALGLKMSIHSGDPVDKGNELFGDTIHLAQQICSVPKPFQLAMTSSVLALVAKDRLSVKSKGLLTLSPQDEQLLETLFSKLEEHVQDTEFDIDDYCREMAMSKSQLYRKTLSLTGSSPNVLIREYRLEKARQLLKKRTHSIAQITFDTGFTSPSYFTKCFKKKYGMLPINYIQLLQ